MKKIIVSLIGLCIYVSLFGAAKKPRIMVVPSTQLLQDMHCIQAIGQQNIPQYQKAFAQDGDLKLAISKINAMMADRGFPLLNLESVLQSKETQELLEANIQNNASGASIQTDPINEILAHSPADIVIYLSYTMHTTGPKHSLSYTLQGIDSYSHKEIASAAGTGQQSMSAEKAVLLEEAVLAYMDTFTQRLAHHFETMRQKGREISVHMRKWEDSNIDFDSTIPEKDDEMLSFIIEDWIADHSVDANYSTANMSGSQLEFTQVHIPLTFMRNKREYPYDARRFAYDLSKYLKTLNLQCKIETVGLGEVYITIGNKETQDEWDF